MKKSTLLIIGGVVAVLTVIVCVICFAAGIVALPREEDTRISEATGVIEAPPPSEGEPTSTPVLLPPTSTPVPPPPPTDTPALPTDTPVPTDTPTPSIPDIEILSHQSYEDGGWFHVVGEVRNNSDKPMQFVEIIVTLYDDANNVTGTDFAYTELDVIPPGGKSPFETGTDEYAGTTQYKLQVQGIPGNLPRQDLIINSHNHYEDGGWLHVRGEVQNTGDTPAEFVKIVVTLYDAAGNVVGTDFAYTDIDTIPPGGTSPFETGTDHYPGFDHYEIYVEGN